ncbi:hypothetical protein OG889_40365 [Streptomyces sp. NBC_00481]|uniref:hypothetical protein n=1 Tax=unclassified Streptomyces TaxID=2593676 RepID=UPI002DD9B917|nr:MULTISPECIES: hypothetical protein [unclassified Streptomyces]WRZ00391.1 hypothetical protein OG889_40365 [Streptomyces sp. NBC_00481]
MEKLTAVGAAIGALEQIARSRELDDKGIFAWPLHRTRYRSSGSFPQKQLLGILKYPNVVAIPSARLLAAGRLLLGNPGQRERALLLAVLTAGGVGMNARHHYGNDGSDQMAQVTFTVSLLAKAFPNDSRAREACLRFVAFQACVSYASAGTVKLVSPMWRNGSAVTGIFRTQSYGDATIYELLKRYPALSVALAWTVILGELAFPLVLVAPRPVARGMLAMGTVFHLANGKFMGLNRFIWAFSGTYPAVAHVSRALPS